MIHLPLISNADCSEPKGKSVETQWQYVNRRFAQLGLRKAPLHNRGEWTHGIPKGWNVMYHLMKALQYIECVPDYVDCIPVTISEDLLA